MTKFNVWYMKPEFGRDGMMGAAWLNEKGMTPKSDDLSKTHVLLKTLELQGGEAQLERVFHEMQGEIWSPNGEARDLIKSKGLVHTSMSVGDIVQIEGAGTWMVDRFGFKELT